LHVVCDLTLASKEHAIFKQTDADVTSFDGYGPAYLAKNGGQKSLQFFSRRSYSAQDGYGDGNAVIPHAELEDTALNGLRKF
jgi:naphthoate synthase